MRAAVTRCTVVTKPQCSAWLWTQRSSLWSVTFSPRFFLGVCSGLCVCVCLTLSVALDPKEQFVVSRLSLQRVVLRCTSLCVRFCHSQCLSLAVSVHISVCPSVCVCDQLKTVYTGALLRNFFFREISHLRPCAS